MLGLELKREAWYSLDRRARIGSLHQIPSALQSVWSNPPSALFFPIHFFNREGNNCQLGAINAAEARHKLTHLPESEGQRKEGRRYGIRFGAGGPEFRNVRSVRPSAYLKCRGGSLGDQS